MRLLFAAALAVLAAPVMGQQPVTGSTNIVDADAGRAIVETADRPNGGLCVDIWHHTRGSNDVEQLRRLSADQIVGVQMSDGPIEPTMPDDYVQDCLRYRVPPGQGEMEAVDFTAELLRLGVDLPWQLEVCNESVWDDAPSDAVDHHLTECLSSMRTVVHEARALVE